MVRAATPEAYALMHNGALALSRMEANGVKIDLDYLHRTMSEIQDRIRSMEGRLWESEVGGRWRRRFGDRAAVDSREQLATILFSDMGVGGGKITAGGKLSADVEVLERLDTPFTRNYTKLQKLKKVYGTYLTGLLRETENGILHPFFSLHTVRTYRSSSSNPNLQNIPIRDPDIAAIIRPSFLPHHPDHHILEIDIKAAEVRVAACYHQDPTMLKYIRENYDMHRDMALECFKLDADDFKTLGQKSYLDDIRQQVKALFVFAEFYGSYWLNVAPSLWEACDRYKLNGPDGRPLKDWLLTHGVAELGEVRRGERPRAGTFTNHIMQVEDNFWNRRFPVYRDWKKRWFAAYQKEGGFSTLTGFRIDGILGRNDVINYPVQGSAFHCLLWCLTDITNWLTARNMRSMLVGQIHDSLLASVHTNELAEFVAYVRHVFTAKLPAAWRWIITPMDIDIALAPLGQSWHQKQKMKLTA